MRVAVCDIQRPFTAGASAYAGHSLVAALGHHGIEAELVALPFDVRSPRDVGRSMLAWRLVDLTETMGRPIDRVIALRFPANLVRHPNKTAWIIGHGWSGELWQGNAASPPGPEAQRIGALVRISDDRALVSARAVLANSQTVAQRLRRFNGIVARPVYHPPPDADRLGPLRSDRYLLCPRPLQLDRAELLVEAMALTRSDARCIHVVDSAHEAPLRRLAAARDLDARITILSRVSRDALIELYANARAVYHGPRREDYSDVPFEAFLSRKPLVTLTDSEGPLEFVDSGVNGYVVAPNPGEVALVIDELMDDPAGADRMGQRGQEAVHALGLSWSRVAEALVA
jgi:hypothetical protein